MDEDQNDLIDRVETAMVDAGVDGLYGDIAARIEKLGTEDVQLVYKIIRRGDVVVEQLWETFTIDLNLPVSD